MERKNLVNNKEKLSELERGDYQTPVDFAVKVCEYLKKYRNINPKVVIEPTCGKGNFIKASVNTFDNISTIYGIEIDKDYYNEVSSNLNFSDEINLNLVKENIFNFKFENIDELNTEEKILILGNPPWVTNSQLEKIDSNNLPIKENLKDLKGIDALMGKSNFDISEYIILKLIEQFKNKNCTIAMLCKNIVIKNIVRDIRKMNLSISNIDMVSFDAKKVFDVSCDASLLILDISDTPHFKCNVYDINEPRDIKRSFGWDTEKDVFISDMEEYEEISKIDGQCPLVWRQGLKHDCSKIMQLKKSDTFYINGNKDEIELEDNYVYPMLKSSDLSKNIILNKSRYHVIVTQKKVREDTKPIECLAPKLWKYLNDNGEFLDKRKSSIYKNAPRFSIFGIGDYSFETYKVCISGFYKEPKFALVFTEDKTPVMLDDTCYFLGFSDYKNALITTVLLNSDIVNKFLKSIAFMDSKRPYTKDILMRIDISKLYSDLSYDDFCSIKSKLDVNEEITEQDYCNYNKIFKNDDSQILFDEIAIDME